MSGHVLHSVFWTNLSPDGSGEPGGALADVLDTTFAGFEGFRAQMTEAAATVQGAGWAVASWEPVGRRLVVQQIYDQGNHGQGTIPLLAIDAWEHAYYLQYENRKTEFFRRHLERRALGRCRTPLRCRPQRRAPGVRKTRPVKPPGGRAHVPERVQRERQVGYVLMLSTLLADRAHEVEAGRATPLDRTEFEDDLIDTIEGCAAGLPFITADFLTRCATRLSRTSERAVSRFSSRRALSPKASACQFERSSFTAAAARRPTIRPASSAHVSTGTSSTRTCSPCLSRRTRLP